MASILPAFEKARYNPSAMIGQLEMAATAYADGVLPLLIDSDVAKESDPNITLPTAFRYPADVDAQLKMSIEAYKRYMNITPIGYIPPYGAMSPAVIPVLRDNGFEWFTSDEQVLRRSEPRNLPSTIPYSVTVDGKTMYGAFSNSLLGNRVNWVYRHYYAENSADDFIRTVLAMAPNNDKKEALVTVVIDGDDAWMHYERDIDGKGIVNGVYRKLNKLFENRTLVSVTMSEYIHGNRMRGVPAHKSADFEKITKLAAGSRFEGTLSNWIGSDETNAAWEALKNARVALGSTTPETSAAYLDNFRTSSFNFFYGATSPAWMEAFNKNSLMKMNPKPFEQAFLAHLATSGRIAGVSMPTIPPFVNPADFTPEWSAPRKRTQVTFLCRLVDREAITSVNIAGNRKELANLEPNMIRMWDNGENGDKSFGDNRWTLILEIDEGELLYKFSNSGGQGTWEGAETFPDDWRRITIEGEKMTIEDVFARMKKY